MFSFSSRKQVVDAIPKVRKIIDLTSPNRPLVNEGRNARRYNRTIPVVLADWTGSGPDLESVGLGFTTDISDHGLGILTQFFPKTRENILGIYLPGQIEEPWYFHVHLASYRLEPQNHLRLGYSIVNFLNVHEGNTARLLTPKLIEILEIQS